MKIFSGILIFLLSSVSISYAQDIPDPMSPPRLVNDFAQIFTSQERDDLETMLKIYDDTTSTQVCIVTVNDLSGFDAADYTARLGQKWDIGQKGKNNGLIILLKPSTKGSRGEVFIAPGYGLEPILTDGRCGRIIDEYMMPYLQQKDYYNATKAAVGVIIGYLSGQFLPEDHNDAQGDAFMWIFAILLFLLMLYMISKSNRNNGNSSGGRGFFPPIFPGGFGRGGGSFGGSGGGFGGFGGGSFGGGGAGRRF